MGEDSKRPADAGLIFATLMMVLGGACAIVGICVSIEWLIGLGIVLICVNSFFAYSALRH